MDEQIPTVLAAVETRISRLAGLMNATGWYSALLHDERFVDARESGLLLAREMMGYVANGAVHSSLNIVEKLGFDPFGRIKARKTFAAVAVGAAEFGLRMGLDYLLRQKQLAANTIAIGTTAAWQGFVHGAAPTVRMGAQAARMADDMGMAYDGRLFLRSFESAAGRRVIELDRPSDPQQRHAMLMEVASVVDTQDATVRSRLSELAEFAGLKDADTDSAVVGFHEVNELTSKVSELSGYLVASPLSDMFEYAQKAEDAARCVFDNDPFAVERLKRRQLVTKGAATVGLAALTYFTGPATDMLLVAAAPIVNAAVGSPREVEQIVKISKALQTAVPRQKPVQTSSDRVGARPRLTT